jgi:hypothetical protein
MSRAEVEALSDEQLLDAWEQVRVAYQSSLPQYLSYHQSLVLFADFVNISTELKKRQLRT